MTVEVIQSIPLEKFLCPPQVRDRLEPERIERMAQSFRAVGQLQPIRARRSGEALTPVDGHYRLAAAKRVGFKTINAIIEERELGEGEVIQRQLIANCQRTDLKSLELARALERLIEVTGWTAGQTGEQLGFSDAKVSGLRKLLALPPSILSQVESGRIPTSAAVELTRIGDPAQQAALAEELAAGRLTRDAVIGKRKQTQRPASKPQASVARVTAVLDVERTITVSGVGLTLERLIESLKALLAKARRSRSQGLELRTFVKMLADQAHRTQPERGA